MGPPERLAYDAAMARFGERLRELREGAGISIAEAGRRSDMSRSHWNDYERGRRANPTLTQMQAMASALGIEVHELLVGVTPDD